MSNEPTPYTFTPEEQEHLADRVLHDADLIEDGAHYNEHGRLVLNAELDAELRNEEIQNIPERTESVESEKSEAESVEISPERLEEIARQSFYAAAPYSRGRRIVFHSPDGSQPHDLFRGLAQHHPSQSLNRAFVEEGVAEVVTVAPVENFDFSHGHGEEAALAALRDKYTAQTWPGGECAGEPYYVFQYITLTDMGQGGERYRYTDHAWRKTDLNYALLLPETWAIELEATIKAKPLLARELTELLISSPDAKDFSGGGDLMHLSSYWSEDKPPYDEWRQADGGVSRMAFRTGSEDGPADAEIINF